MKFTSALAMTFLSLATTGFAVGPRGTATPPQTTGTAPKKDVTICKKEAGTPGWCMLYEANNGGYRGRRNMCRSAQPCDVEDNGCFFLKEQIDGIWYSSCR
ncbi:hypothetical protein E6O75_ATG10285 [Venturia nashicola]|uniref:Uncharacterized protein n=1 Tax=Venturia nashicola TaxID=86259 RepID=A0A4Z1NZN5_9PEZI|nr:hypothetical protein E6O75_ATG10285 [Venturia nashicola]